MPTRNVPSRPSVHRVIQSERIALDLFRHLPYRPSNTPDGKAIGLGMVEDGFDVFIVLVLPSALLWSGVQAWVDGHAGHNGTAHDRGFGGWLWLAVVVLSVLEKEARVRGFVPKYKAVRGLVARKCQPCGAGESAVHGRARAISCLSKLAVACVGRCWYVRRPCFHPGLASFMKF